MPRVSKIGTLLKQVIRFGEKMDDMERELKDAQQE